MDFSEMFSTTRMTAASVIGFAAMFTALFIYSFRSRKKILVTKLIADVIWFFHYILLGPSSYSAAALNLIGAVRETVFYNKDKKWARSILWVFVFIGAAVTSTVLAWAGPVSVLPLVGSSLAVIAVRLNKPLLIRISVIPSLVLWLIYSILIGSLPSTLCNIFSIISVMIGFCKDLKDHIAQKNSEKE